MRNVLQQYIKGQDDALEQLARLFIDRKQFTGGVLLTGPEGVGKRTAALVVAAYQLQPAGDALFGFTKNKFNAEVYQRVCDRNHPDMLLIDDVMLNEMKGSSGNRERDITVDIVRMLQKRLSVQSYESNNRVIIIDNADRMNLSTANAFLKLLEEPPPGNMFCLISSHPFRIPSTIRSRCMKISFKPLPEETVYSLLTDIHGIDDAPARECARLAHGSIAQALLYAEHYHATTLHWLTTTLDIITTQLKDPRKLFALSAAIHGNRSPEPIRQWFDLMMTMLFDVLCFQNGISDAPRIPGDVIMRFAGSIPVQKGERLYQLMQLVEHAVFRIETFNINKRLAVESLIGSMVKLIHQPELSYVT